MNGIKKLISYGSVIVADTGDIEFIKKFKPTDVTTNPSLILSAVNNSKYKHLVNSDDLEQVLVNFGSEILKYIDGYVSTEVNPEYSYNTEKTIETARKIIDLYKKKGVSKDRVLIKIASTWEGIEAARILEKENIKCNMTLIFSKVQALACAQASVTLISPFIGRITDWYKNKGHQVNSIEDDIGVNTVKEIYIQLKSNQYKTIIMGASFRNIDQIKALTGVDRLTVSPKLLYELQEDKNNNFNKISVYKNNKCNHIIKKEDFENEMNDNEMLRFNLENGIKRFIDDNKKIINVL